MKNACLSKNDLSFKKRQLLMMGGCAVLEMIPNLLSGQAYGVEPRGSERYIYLKVFREVQAAVQVGGCAQLKSEAKSLQERAKAFRTDASGKLAQDYLSSVATERAKWKAEISELRRLVDKADIDEAFAKGNFFASIALTAAGVAFTSPLAVGTAIVAQVVGGTATFGWQIALTQGKSGRDDGVGYIVGYQGDRVLMLSGDALRSSEGAVAKLASKAITGISLVVATWNYYAASKDTDTARMALRIAAEQFELLGKAIDEFGTDSTKWKEYAATAHEAAGSSLVKFAKQYAASDCRLIDSVDLKRDNVIKIGPAP